MKTNIVKLVIIFLFSVQMLHTKAQQEPSSAEELAKELANPNTTLGTMAFPIDYIHYSGDLPGASSQNGEIVEMKFRILQVPELLPLMIIVVKTMLRSPFLMVL